MTTPPTPLPRALGEAENAMRATLLKVISGSGLGYEQWVALQLISTASSALPVDALAERIRVAAKIETETAKRVIAVLVKDEWLIADSDHVRPGSRAIENLPALKARTIEQTNTLLNGIEPKDIETTTRVLIKIAERASAALA